MNLFGFYFSLESVHGERLKNPEDLKRQIEGQNLSSTI